MKNQFFLLSFIPAIVYWYLEETQTIQVAVIGGVTLALLEVFLEKIFTKHVHSLSKLNLVILLVLGPISLIGEDGLWFKLQPMFTGIFLFSYFFFNLKKGNSVFLKMMDDLKMPAKMPSDIMKRLEKHMAIFLLCYGLFMGVLAKFYSTSIWAFFKTFGFYGVFFVFMLIEMFFIKRFMKKELQKKQMMEIMEMMRPE